MTDSIVISGAAAKGAFAAGVLSVLFNPEENPNDLNVKRVVGASSGALNGLCLAAGLARKRPNEACQELVALWRERATALHAFVPSLSNMISLKGMCSSKALLTEMRHAIPLAASVSDIDFLVSVTPASGENSYNDDGRCSTTYEHMEKFSSRDFENESTLEDMFQTVAASAAFPGVFAPVEVDMEGRKVPCWDGGLSNNTPIGFAIGPTTQRVFVIDSFPSLYQFEQSDLSAVNMLEHLGEIVLAERLRKDLNEAERVNRILFEMEEDLNFDEREKMRKILGWENRKQIEIVRLTPEFPLRGGTFAAAFDKDLREDYIVEGKNIARRWIKEEEKKSDNLVQKSEGES